MSRFEELYRADLSRYAGGGTETYIKRWHYLFRKAQTTENPFIKKVYHYLLVKHGSKNGLDIDYPVKIAGGLYIGHPYGITINDEVTIGRNCNIHKGVTIGRENRGKRKGTPIIGNDVWIGIGSTIVGNVSIGNDVLIAPGSFVNCDVPDHSVVFGNPCRISSRENATEGYVQNRVGE